jgi:hypothetical protein
MFNAKYRPLPAQSTWYVATAAAVRSTPLTSATAVVMLDVLVKLPCSRLIVGPTAFVFTSELNRMRIDA